MNIRVRNVYRSLAGVFCAGTILLIAWSLPAQNLFEADEGSGNIYEFTTNGVQSTFATGLSSPTGLVFNSAGDLFVSAGNSIYEFISTTGTLSPTPMLFASGLDEPKGLAFNNAGDLFVTSENVSGLGLGGNAGIIEITPGGTKSTFASELQNPSGLAFNSAGMLFVLAYTNGSLLTTGSPFGHSAIIEITAGGIKSTYPSPGTNNDFGLAFNSDGALFAANDSLNGFITEYTSAGSQVIDTTGLDYPTGMTFDGEGNLFVSNSGADNYSIVEITPEGGQKVFTTAVNLPKGLAIQPWPALQAIGAGIQANQFGFTLIGSNNEVVVVEACTNLSNPVWQSQATDMLNGGSFYFSDSLWTNYTSRYYRLQSQ